MSLFFLANTDDGKKNNQYTAQFRDEINIPAHAKVSVEKAFIPLNGLIVIDGINRKNNQFIITIKAPPSTASNLYLRLLCTIADGVYDAYSFADAIENAILIQFSAYLNPFGVGTGGVFPAQNPWGSAGAGEVPAEWVEPQNWTCEVEYVNNVNQDYYIIRLFNTKVSASARKLLFSFDVSGNDGGVAFDAGIGINSLAYILQTNYIFDNEGNPAPNFGKISNELQFQAGATAPNGYNAIQVNTGNSVLFNGQDTGDGKAFTNALIIEIPELNTEFYNSFTKTKSPAVAIVPYSFTKEDYGYVLYEPRFPLELQCGHETLTQLNTLSIYIKNADGTPAMCANTVDKTYIVLRIETEQDIEKDITREVKREARKEKIKASKLYIGGGFREFLDPKQMPQPREPSLSSSFVPLV